MEDEILKKFKNTEFGYVNYLTTEEIDQFLFEGFIPMVSYDYLSEIYLFLIKLHFERSIISPIVMHTGKTVKRKSKEYTISIDYDFNRVYKGVNRQFGKECWFCKPLYKNIQPLICNNNSLTSFHSFELWNKNNELVAGDIGVVSGSRYLSMTGFYSENGAGTVLLHSIGKILPKLGFEVWDLGMDLPYKRSLGSKLISRKNFLALVKETRDKKIEISKQKFECEKLLKWNS